MLLALELAEPVGEALERRVGDADARGRLAEGGEGPSGLGRVLLLLLPVVLGDVVVVVLEALHDLGVVRAAPDDVDAVRDDEVEESNERRGSKRWRSRAMRANAGNENRPKEVSS